MTRAQARIDLDAFAHNLDRLRSAAPGSAQMAIVKADAYGHGLLPMARAARESGAQWLGVALFTEALQLRANGDDGPILTWLASPSDPWADVLEADVDLGVSTPAQLGVVAAAHRATGRRARVHLKADTGLGRAGCPMEQWPAFVEEAKSLQDRGVLEIVGIWSHFTVADDPRNPLNTVQIQRFGQAVSTVESMNLQVEHLHLANSAATLALPDAHFTMVRPGIAMYGISPGAAMGTPADLGLRPVMTLVAELSVVKRLPAGVGPVVRPSLHAGRRLDHGRGPARLRRRDPAQRDQCRTGLRRGKAPQGRWAGLHGPVRRWTSATTRRRRATRWCSSAAVSTGCLGGGLGRSDRHHRLRDRDPVGSQSGAGLHRRWIVRGLVALAAGVVAGIAAEHLVMRKPWRADPFLHEDFGSVRGEPHWVRADDGAHLYAEVHPAGPSAPDDRDRPWVLPQSGQLALPAQAVAWPRAAGAVGPAWARAQRARARRSQLAGSTRPGPQVRHRGVGADRSLDARGSLHGRHDDHGSCRPVPRPGARAGGRRRVRRDQLRAPVRRLPRSPADVWRSGQRLDSTPAGPDGSPWTH